LLLKLVTGYSMAWGKAIPSTAVHIMQDMIVLTQQGSQFLSTHRAAGAQLDASQRSSSRRNVLTRLRKPVS
jgi:hypothetical protein